MYTKLPDKPTKKMILDLAAQEQVEFINVQFTDLYGVVKAITVPVDKLAAIIDGSYISGFTWHAYFQGISGGQACRMG